MSADTPHDKAEGIPNPIVKGYLLKNCPIYMELDQLRQRVRITAEKQARILRSNWRIGLEK